eukprot:jgi/Botrbrau1/13767/Bobra.0056s0022.1
MSQRLFSVSVFSPNSKIQSTYGCCAGTGLRRPSPCSHLNERRFRVARISRKCAGEASPPSTEVVDEGPLDNQEESRSQAIPTRLNNVPHLRETRRWFYEDCRDGVLKALAAGESRLQVKVTIPETNPEVDVYRVGTLLELVREIATALAQDGKCVKVCVQGAMGSGTFKGMPLSLSGCPASCRPWTGETSRSLCPLEGWTGPGGCGRLLPAGGSPERGGGLHHDLPL